MTMVEHAPTILIVEDDPDNMFLIKTMVQTFVEVGFCDGRASGAQLFGLLAAKPRLKPDLVLLDIQIPHEDGYTILEQIRSRPLLKGALVVAVTANILPQDVARCRRAGFDGFIGKPIRMQGFPDQVRRILAGESVWEPL
jgi:two-component system, cell cycle response regulator DivK